MAGAREHHAGVYGTLISAKRKMILSRFREAERELALPCR